MHWATNYIGIPWVFGGRDILNDGGVDCYGFFKYIQKTYYGVTTDEVIIDEYNHRNVIKTFDTASEFKNWRVVDTPRDGDAVLLRTAKYPSHIGVWLDNGDDVKGVLHCVEKTGVVYTNIASLELAHWRIASYYRHTTKGNINDK